MRMSNGEKSVLRIGVTRRRGCEPGPGKYSLLNNGGARGPTARRRLA